MKIKRVDDKQMVIHTKEKTKIHTYEAKSSSIKAANTYTVNAENGEKTENGEYISSYECDPETVDAPEKYIGKIVKMNGQFVAYTNQDESQYYPAVIIADATACCSQGLEFVLEGNPSYPEGYPEIDLSIAQENMWLMTDSLGLGGVWLGIAPIQERMDKVREILNISEELEAFSLFPIGYPDEVKEQQDRFEEARIHYVR